MKNPPPGDSSNLSMMELFRVEADTQMALLTSGLLELERGPTTAAHLESLMRAAHSLKGAARIVNLPCAVRVAHAMEDCFVAAQQGRLELRHSHVDLLLRGVDLLAHISKHAEKDLAAWEADHASNIADFVNAVGRLRPAVAPGPTAAHALTPALAPLAHVSARQHEPSARVLRLNAENLNRLLGLAGEALVESRWLRPFSESMQRLKRMQSDLGRTLEGLRLSLESEDLSEASQSRLNELFRQAAEARRFLGDRLQELDLFDRRATHLTNRLYLEVLRTRMRPFSDGTRRFPRMVRDLARSLGKQARLQITGENTQVDRDILDRLEQPMAHLLRNAVDPGCETPEERERAGKPAEGTISVEARHSAGMLLVTVADDGAGLDPERLRRAIVEKKLTTPALVERMTEAELLQFLFLPGFTLRDTVTELSGRGVGLDIVQNMVRSVRGSVRVSTQPGRGMKFQLQLPLTMSVLRALLVEVGGEPYAFPLAQIARTLRLPRDKIETLEGRQHFRLGEQTVGLLAAHQVFESAEARVPETAVPIVVLGDHSARFGLLVDRFLGERELVVQPLDPRLGKVKDISAGALMEDGSPVLIVDVDDLIHSIEKLIARDTPLGGTGIPAAPAPTLPPIRRKRILAVDDSLTVRELERKLLTSHGYLADVAVDGMDGWNAVRTGVYDLVITDVDMPRLDGIELATLIKRDPRLKSLPVMIISYKDREEDRLRGLDAGADYYLAKGSFQDETMLQAIVDLIGEPES